MLGFFPGNSKLNSYDNNLTPQTNLEGPNFKELLKRVFLKPSTSSENAGFIP